MDALLFHVVAWLLLPAGAVVNGIVREKTYGRRLSATVSHSLSVIPLVVLILAWAVFLASRAPLDARSAWAVGAIWLGLTVAFEFGLGALRGRRVGDMLADYDVRRGRLWVLVPLSTGLAPTLARLAG